MITDLKNLPNIELLHIAKEPIEDAKMEVKLLVGPEKGNTVIGQFCSFKGIKERKK